MSASCHDFHNEVGMLIRDGRPETAVDRLRSWIQDQPDDEIAMSLLGSALLRLARHGEALDVFRQAVRRFPASFGAHGDLGFALLKSEQPVQARAAFAEAVRLNPGFYQGWCHLGRLAFEAGETEAAGDAFRHMESCDPFAEEASRLQRLMQESRFADAEKICRHLLRRQPGYPRAAHALAHLAAQVGAFEEAADILSRGIAFFPCDINLRQALIVNLEECGQYARALQEAEAVTRLIPDTALSWLILGRVHGHCGRYEDSLECYDRAIELIGDRPLEAGNTELLRGHILKILGRYRDAIEAYRASIRKVPGNGAGWWGLADMKTWRFSTADVEAMEAICSDESARVEQRTQAAFALGKANEDQGRFDEAFAWYRKGNELRSGVRYDPAAQDAGIDAIRRAFDAETLGTQARPVPEGPVPIFIVGLPRSGSTLLEQILASHSQVEGTMELAALPNLVRRINIEGGRTGLQYPDSIRAFGAGELSAFGQSWLDDTAMYRSDKPFFIDKLPTNFDKVGLIHMILPQAIVIDARRHPLDCGLSCFKQHFAGGHMFSYRLETIAHYYRSYLSLMDHWDAVLPGKVLCVAYEAVIEDTERSVRRMLAHCGLPFEESCLRFFENPRPVRTASSEQVRQPVYRKGVGYWRNFEARLEPLVSALGAETLARFSDQALVQALRVPGKETPGYR